MADNLDDGEFWLPPAFLSDDVLLLEEKDMGSKGYSQTDLFSYGFRSLGTSSDLGSPAESVMGSTETESDDEDFMAGLTRRMARSTLQDDVTNARSVISSENRKLPKVLAGSPQSTLYDLGRGCGCKQGSSHGSPIGPSRGSSPPPPPTPTSWALLYTGAGGVSRMSMKDEGTGYYDDRSLYGLLQNPCSAASYVKCNANSNGGLYYDQSLHHLRFQATQLLLLKQIEMMKQKSHGVWGGGQAKDAGHYQHPQLVQNGARNEDFLGNRSSRAMDLSPSAWPPLQEQHKQQQQKHQMGSSGVRAGVLDSPATKRASVGTGVFLPRRLGNASVTRKKPVRVMQPINMNLVELGAQTHLQLRSNRSFATDSDVTLDQQKRIPQPTANPEFRLPQEWTY